MIGHIRNLCLLLAIGVTAAGCCCFDTGCFSGCSTCGSYAGYDGPSCGCEASCGIEAGCGIEASCGIEPSCGVGPGCSCEPACGIEPGCDIAAGCSVAPACGCEPTCGCEPACECEPACGIAAGCGCEATCGIEPSCGFGPSCGCEPSCGCGAGAGCSGGCGVGGIGCWGWRDDVAARRAGWKECGPLLRPWLWGCAGGCGELYFDEWINDPPACCDPCPRGNRCGGCRSCNSCAQYPFKQKIKSDIRNYFARRKQDWINSGFMCDTDRCRTHSSHHGRGCDCGQCNANGYVGKRKPKRHAEPHSQSFSSVLQATFSR